MERLSSVLFAVFILIAVNASKASALDPVSLSSPTNVTHNSITLNWDQTTSPDSEFFCYKILYSTEANADLSSIISSVVISVPAIGMVGLILLSFAFVIVLSRKRWGQKAIPIIALACFIFLEMNLFASAETTLIDCIQNKSITSYQVTGLNAETTYYFKIYVFDMTGNSVESNEITRDTFSISLGSGARFDSSTFGTAAFE